MNDSFAKKLNIGIVELNVRDFKLMKDFYTKSLLLDVIDESTEIVTLGRFGNPLIRLHGDKSLSLPEDNSAGLYHFAIVFSSRGDLARTIFNIFKTSPKAFTGSGDHLVSEAFYFYDPEYNGIELYFDRDRSTWLWDNGQVKMATLYIDPQEYLQRYLVLEEEDSDAIMGHIHLKVGDIKKAKEFYVDVLGFDITAILPQALFISIGGYHHHIGLNTWESFGALERGPGTGLKSYELLLGENDEINELRRRLSEHSVQYKEVDDGISFFDPWNNELKIKVK